jgi:hypothetical protein
VGVARLPRLRRHQAAFAAFNPSKSFYSFAARWSFIRRRRSRSPSGSPRQSSQALRYIDVWRPRMRRRGASSAWTRRAMYRAPHPLVPSPFLVLFYLVTVLTRRIHILAFTPFTFLLPSGLDRLVLRYLRPALYLPSTSLRLSCVRRTSRAKKNPSGWRTTEARRKARIGFWFAAKLSSLRVGIAREAGRRVETFICICGRRACLQRKSRGEAREDHYTNVEPIAKGCVQQLWERRGC